MRAPADSTKPITGTRERSASSSTATTVSAWASPSEPPANEASCAKTATARPSTRPLAPSTPSPGPRLLAHPPREHLGSQQVERAWIAQHLQAFERRQPLVGSGDERKGHVASRQSTVLWPPKPNELEIAIAGRPSASSSGRASRGTKSRSSSGSGSSSPSVGGIDARAQREDRRDRLDGAGGAEQVADRRLGRRDRDGGRTRAERRLERERLGAVVEWGRGAVRVDVDDVSAVSPLCASARPIAVAAPVPVGSGAVTW